MAVRWVLHRPEIERLDSPIMAFVEDTGEDVRDAAKGISPVDEGDMRETIRTADSPRRLAIRVVVGGMPGPVTGKPVDYAHFVERGTSKMSAQPFMRPALFRAR